MTCNQVIISDFGHKLNRLKDVPCQRVAPMSEFRVAYEEAISNGAKVYLGDRPIHVSPEKSILSTFSKEITAIYT